jgi:hypothetical protein
MLGPDAHHIPCFRFLWLYNGDIFKYGQQIVFLGILIDSASMTVRFDPISAKSFHIELEVYLKSCWQTSILKFSTGSQNFYKVVECI